MSGKLSKPFGLRLHESTIEYYTNLAKEDKRALVDYLRIVLETVEQKKLTWQQLAKDHPPT